MKHLLSLFACFAIFISGFSQFEIGNITQTFTYTDSNGNTKDIDAEIFYPADNPGSAVLVADGSHPVIVLGHGFLMTVDAYYNYRDYFVPKGYILVLPTSEGSFTPDHGAFGEDLVAMAEGMMALNDDPISLFMFKVSDKMAVAGHSMGGGASFLAAASSNLFTTMVNFAAAETTPSAIAAAASITIPSLIFAGDEDCVAPPDTNQETMYNALPDCKAYTLIAGGSHCQFANSNVTCEAGEIICFGATFISSAAQHQAIFEVMDPWLEYLLMEQSSAGADFLALQGASTSYTLNVDCPDFLTLVDIPDFDLGSSYFNNQSNTIIIAENLVGTYTIADQMGRMIQTGALSQHISVDELKPGIYIFIVESEQGIQSLKFVK